MSRPAIPNDDHQLSSADPGHLHTASGATEHAVQSLHDQQDQAVSAAGGFLDALAHDAPVHDAPVHDLHAADSQHIVTDAHHY